MADQAPQYLDAKGEPVAPDALDAKGNPISAPAMNFAVVNNERVNLDDSPVERFAHEAGRVITAPLDLAGKVLTDPKAAGRSVVEPSVEHLNQAVEATKAGKPDEAFGHLLASFPFLGPAIASEIERARKGDVAGALGGLGAMAAPVLAKPTATAVVEGVKRVPGADAVLEPVAAAADRASTNAMTRATAPTIGQNKLRFANTAARLAPELARDPGLNAWTRSGLAGRISDALDESEAALDAAHDARGNTQAYPTKPLLDALRQRRSRLVAEAVPGSQMSPQMTSGVQQVPGQGVMVGPPQPKAVPIGDDVVPAPNRARVAQINQAIAEVQRLGPVARYESLRRIREAYDGPAKAVYNPALTPDFLAKRGQSLGAADVTGSIREYLANIDPNAAIANRNYSLFKSAHDVLAATEEVERARPTVGRQIMSRLIGAKVGEAAGGFTGEVTGVLLGPLLDRWSGNVSAGMKIQISRRLASLADALRSGNAQQATTVWNSLKQFVPPMKTATKLSVSSAGVDAGLVAPGMAKRTDQQPTTASAR